MEWVRNANADRGRVEPPPARARGFTLIEILCVLAVLAILLSILLPSLSRGLATARSFKCQVNLRGIAFDFTVFADDLLHGSRGTDDANYGRRRFSLETFMESQYGVDEFWSWNDADLARRPASAGDDPMRCAEMTGEVVMRRHQPCRAGAIGPTQNISFGFNMRLFRIETLGSRGRPGTREVQLSSAITQQGRVPLAWDVDGAAAAERDAPAVFSAPALASRSLYAGDAYWYPGARHLGAANYALIDGSVHTSANPLGSTGWDWAYQPK